MQQGSRYGFGVAAFTALMVVACGGSTTENPAGAGGVSGSGAAAGSGGTSTGGTTGGSGGTSAGGSGGIITGGSGGTATGGAGTGGTACSPACGEGRACCDSQCVNLTNDPHDCGSCGTTCSGDTYCSGGQCVPPPCSATCTAGTCCGSACCSDGQLCCDPQGPLDTGPHCMEPSDQGTCPQGCAPLCVCASPDTPIATPTGDRPISSLRAGDLVYSVDGSAIRAVPLVFVHRTAVSQHHVVRVKLASGPTLEISGGHPTADGRTFDELRVGDRLDASAVVSVESIPYEHAYTYDILPASDSGTYFAGHALIGSTLQGVAPGEVNERCTGAP